MKITNRILGVVAGLALTMGVAQAGKYADTETLFRNAGESGTFFKKSYAYAVFPTVGEAGFIVGGALGKGRVYVHHHFVGNTTMTQGSIGFQAGGKAYSQIIFFEDKQSLEQFQSGSFEFSAGASAVAITASAQASASTDGSSAGASGYEKAAANVGSFYKGMAVFTIAKGGLMYAATIAGQHFSYSPRGAG